MHLNLFTGATLGTLSTCWDVLIKNLFVKMYFVLLLFCSSSARERNLSWESYHTISISSRTLPFRDLSICGLEALKRTGETSRFDLLKKSFNASNNKMLDTLKRECVCRPSNNSFVISQNWLFITRHSERYSAFIQFNLASCFEPCAICYNSPNKTQLAWISPDSWWSLVSNWNALVNIKCFN